MFDFGITIWHSILVVDFGSRFLRSILDFFFKVDGPFWRSILVFHYGPRFWQSNFGTLFWRLILALDFGIQFWHSILAIDFGAPFWLSILALNFAFDFGGRF